MKKKRIPKFRSEDQEREFCSNADSTDYLDWGEAKRIVLPNLKPSQNTISLRLPKMMLVQLKVFANTCQRLVVSKPYSVNGLENRI